MKAKIICTIFLVAGFFVVSCSSAPSSFSQSWAASGREGKTIRLMGVTVDRSGGWDSLEKEVAAIAPMFFWRKGYRLLESDGPADYAAQISLREREFAAGWKTRRSLAIEVRVWEYEGECSAGELSGKLPSAAGRVVSIGDGSFASSRTTGKMLSRAIGRTVGRMPSKKLRPVKMSATDMPPEELEE
jgi:hypothetical protein